MYQQQLVIQTRGRGTRDITAEIRGIVAASGVRTGLCNVFVHHTSASLLLTENADPQVRADLENYFARLVPDGDAIFRHTDEGPDDMPSHVRTVLTETSLIVPVTGGELALGTWQGIFLYEHRHSSNRRLITVTVQGA